MQASADVFRAHRGRLFGLAYRMIGQLAEAEDVVQEAYTRYLEYGPENVRDPVGFLVTVATRICVDRLKAARGNREQYFGPWLPEPFLTTPDESPEEEIVHRESLSFGILLLLEQLSPVERAVFILREAFGYDFSEIAQFVDKAEGNCRVILHRARQRIRQPHQQHLVTRDKQLELLDAFIEATEAGDMTRLIAVLHEDVGLVADGGGKVPAAQKAVIGAEKVIAFMFGLAKRFGRVVSGTVAEVNGTPGLLLWHQGGICMVVSTEFWEGRIHRLHVVLNPDKLGHVAEQLGVGVCPVLPVR